MNYGEFWVGLINPNSETCDDDGCENKLEWASDGSNFDNWADPSHAIRVNGGTYCLRYRDDKLDDWTCVVSNYYVCELKCPLTTTSTTTTTTTTTPGTLS